MKMQLSHKLAALLLSVSTASFASAQAPAATSQAPNQQAANAQAVGQAAQQDLPPAGDSFRNDFEDRDGQLGGQQPSAQRQLAGEQDGQLDGQVRQAPTGHAGLGTHAPAEKDCHCRPGYETRYRTVKKIEYREEYETAYVDEVCKVPEQITETHYRTIEDVIEKTVVDYKLVKEDCGCYEQQAYVDDYGCNKYRKVWVPRYVTKKVPYERVVKQYVTRQVPYEVTRTIYKEIVKKVPVRRKKMVPFVVYTKVPYYVPKKTCHDTPGYGEGGYADGGRGEGGYGEGGYGDGGYGRGDHGDGGYGDFRPVGYGG